MMDLEVVMKSNACPFIVQFYGAVFKEGDCWICMELMDSSLEQFYKFVYRRMNERIGENIIGQIALAVSQFMFNFRGSMTCVFSIQVNDIDPLCYRVPVPVAKVSVSIQFFFLYSVNDIGFFIKL